MRELLKASPSDKFFCSRMSHALILSRHVVGTNQWNLTMTAKLDAVGFGVWLEQPATKAAA
jgi:hypothetical protein